MSARKLLLVLTPRAVVDFGDILLRTEQRWGKRQRTSYKSEFDRALLTLRRYPDLGRPREDLRPGLRSHHVGQHVIFYRVTTEAVRIDRILHARMDAHQHFDEPPEKDI